MTFMHQGKKVIVKGDPSLTKAKVSLKNIIKTQNKSDQGYLVRALEGRGISAERGNIEEVLTVEESLSVVLNNFEDVFEWLERLPEERN